jgi:hypothetical protein
LTGLAIQPPSNLIIPQVPKASVAVEETAPLMNTSDPTVERPDKVFDTEETEIKVDDTFEVSLASVPSVPLVTWLIRRG